MNSLLYDKTMELVVYGFRTQAEGPIFCKMGAQRCARFCVLLEYLLTSIFLNKAIRWKNEYTFLGYDVEFIGFNEGTEDQLVHQAWCSAYKRTNTIAC